MNNMDLSWVKSFAKDVSSCRRIYSCRQMDMVSSLINILFPMFKV